MIDFKLVVISICLVCGGIITLCLLFWVLGRIQDLYRTHHGLIDGLMVAVVFGAAVAFVYSLLANPAPI